MAKKKKQTLTEQDILKVLVENEFLFHDTEAVGNVTLKTKLDDIDIDSLDLITISISMDAQYDIEISDSKLKDLITVGDFVKIILETYKEQNNEF